MKLNKNIVVNFLKYDDLGVTRMVTVTGCGFARKFCFTVLVMLLLTKQKLY